MIPTRVPTQSEDHTLRTEWSMDTNHLPDNDRTFRLHKNTAPASAVLSVRAQIEQVQQQQQQEQQQQQMLPAQRYLEVGTG